MSLNLKNEHTIIGYVSIDPEISTLPNGTVKASVRVPVDRTYKDKDGEKITDWFNLEAFGKQAEIIAEYVKKGTLVVSKGTINIQNWEKDGVKHSKWVHNIQSFQMLGSRDKNTSGGDQSARRQSTGAKAPAKAATKPADEDFAMDDDELPPF